MPTTRLNMPTIPQFDPPAGLVDFDGIPEQRAAWDDFITQSFQWNINYVEKNDQVGVGKCQFYNEKVTSTDQPVATDPIRWKGFPLLVAAKHPGNKKAAWIEADQLVTERGIQYRPQDEYLEWFVTRNAQGKITRIAFTCEGPEYWEALAQGYPSELTLPVSEGGLGGTKNTKAVGDQQKLVGLYQQLVDPSVQLSDLLDSDGSYNRWNKWNTTHGAVHLTHPSNTLGAEINIAARATVLRQTNGQLIMDPNRLICCSGYGNRFRASDPHIGDEVNKLARGGFAITLLNPVGLYIDSLEAVGWTTPDGTPASQFWNTVRGATGTAVRAIFEVPSNLGFTIGDIKIGGQPIQYGGQVAEHINVKLTGIACRQGSFKNAPLRCPEPPDCSNQPLPKLLGVPKAAFAAGSPPQAKRLNVRR
jgi:hypothetical protein